MTSSVLRFVRAYVKSMRLYYSFITGICGWIGVSFYQYVARTFGTIGSSHLRHTREVPTPPEKTMVILVILFLSWGINQIINDYLGLKEDRINAPLRPMVTGELRVWPALALSALLIVGTFLVTAWYLQPVAILPLLAGILLNVIYEYAKSYGIWGNLVFGVMISTCAVFGFCASGPVEIVFTKSRVSVLVLIVILNGLMTYYTYFKDFKGDRAAGKRTLVVRHGLHTARWIGVFSAFLPSLAFAGLYYGLGAIEIELNRVFVILSVLTVFLQVWTGVSFFVSPVGDKTYTSLEINFRAAACGQATLIALFNPELGMILFLCAYIFVGFLFQLQRNDQQREKSSSAG
jgi:geranylgeranylglycerol-phosphate geranylgeranyltransferase